MNNKIKAPPIVTIAVLTVITIVFWIAFEVFRAFTKAPVTEVQPQVLLPLSPNLDSTVLDKLQNRVYIKDAEISDDFKISQPVQTASPSAIVEEPETSTESGTVSQ